MNRLIVIIAGVLLAVGLAAGGFRFFAEVYHARRFQACRRELDRAVRSAKSLDAFTDDERRGWYRTYAREQRQALLEHVQTRDHTEHDYSEIAAKSDSAHTSAVFNIGDMVYVLFFDSDSRLRSYVCLSN
jgi:hypothetical protein